MNRLFVHFTAAAACVQMGCQPEANSPSSELEVTGQEIDGTQLVRIRDRFHVATVFTGTAIWKYSNGNRRNARTYKNGILEGPMVAWYDDGQTKLYSVTYRANEKDGVARGFFKDGKKKYEITYIKGVRDNVETWWYNNGQKQYEFVWAKGVRANMTTWDIEGNKMKIPEIKSPAPQRQPERGSPSKGGAAPSTNQRPAGVKQPQAGAKPASKNN